MSDHAKLLVAVSLSMMITSGLHYMLEQTARTHSFFQTIYLNYIRDFLLYTRCRYYEQGCEYSILTSYSIFKFLICS